jgi:hypothetical protein
MEVEGVPAMEQMMFQILVLDEWLPGIEESHFCVSMPHTGAPDAPAHSLIILQ